MTSSKIIVRFGRELPLKEFFHLMTSSIFQGHSGLTWFPTMHYLVEPTLLIVDFVVL
jgi:hypothetical protein